MKILTVISLLAAVLSTHLDCLAVSGLFPLPTNGCPYKAPCYNDRYEFVDIKQFQSPKENFGDWNPNIHPKSRGYDNILNHTLDSLNVINWESDTLTVLIDDNDIVSSSQYTAIRSNSAAFMIYIDIHKIPEVTPLKEYIDSTEGVVLKMEVSNLYCTILTWDMGQIQNLFRFSIPSGDNITYNAYHIIIKDHKIINIEGLVFPLCFYWRLRAEDFPGQKEVEEWRETCIKQRYLYKR